MTSVVGLVAAREIRTRLRSRAFRISTVALLVVLIAGILLLRAAGGEKTHTIGLTPSAAPLAAVLTAAGTAANYPITTVTVDPSAGVDQVDGGDLTALVTGTPDHFGVVVKKTVPTELDAVLRAVARQEVLDQQLRQVGADPAAISAAVAAASYDVHPLEVTRALDVGRLVLAYVTGILVYIGVLVYGQMVAQGVVEEKTSRVVELLLTSIRPWHLLLGKVLGIGLVGLLQLVVVAGGGLITGLSTHSIDFPASVAAGAVVWAVVWFLLGYLLYALLFASLGALVSRQEEVSGATAPVQILVIVPYVISVSVLPLSPENRVAEILSLIPLFTPLIMPFRVALGVAAPWELWFGVVATALTVVGAVWLAGRVYRNAVLRIGSKVALRDALKAAR